MRVILFLSFVGLLTIIVVAAQVVGRLLLMRRKPPEKIEEFPPIRRVK